MEDKERKTPIDFGVKRSKVKVIVTCPSGALSDYVSFLVHTKLHVLPKLKSNIFWKRMVTSCQRMNKNPQIKSKKNSGDNLLDPFPLKEI